MQAEVETTDQLRIRQLKSEISCLQKANQAFADMHARHCRTIRQMQLSLERRKRTIKVWRAALKENK